MHVSAQMHRPGDYLSGRVRVMPEREGHRPAHTKGNRNLPLYQIGNAK